jgi:hypothetical protein
MNDRMRRRIERSRARCEKTATNQKTDKEQEASKQASGQQQTARDES